MNDVISTDGQSARFGALINELIETAKLDAVKIVKKLAFDGYAGVIRRTPVDTGRARASWNLSLDVENLAVASVPGDPGVGFAAKRAERVLRLGAVPPSMSEKATSALAPFQWGQTIFISNNLPYILPLENGSSKQAPYGMARLTLIELEGSLQGAVDSVRVAA